MALEGRAAVEQVDEEEEEDEEVEQNVPAAAAAPSVGKAVSLPDSRGATRDTGDAGIWEGGGG